MNARGRAGDNLTGRKFGNLVVLGRSEKRDARGNKVNAFNCVCVDCGGVTRMFRQMLTERTPSCKLCRPMKANTKSGVRGVVKQGEKYVAKIRFGGENRHLGTFHSLREATAARQNAELTLFGNTLNIRRSLEASGIQIRE